MNTEKAFQRQQSLEKYFSSFGSSEAAPIAFENSVMLTEFNSESCTSDDDVTKRAAVKNSAKPLILSESTFANNNNSPTSPAAINGNALDALDVTVLDIGTPKRAKNVSAANDASAATPAAAIRRRDDASSDSPVATIDISSGGDDSDDEPIAKKIKIDAKKYEKIRKFAPKGKSANKSSRVAQDHLSRAVSAVLKQTNAVNKAPPVKRQKMDENKTVNGGAVKQKSKSTMPVLKKQQPPPPSSTVKQKLLTLKSAVATPPSQLAKKFASPPPHPLSVMKPLHNWIQAGKISIRNAQDILKRSPFLPLTRLEVPRTATTFKIMQKAGGWNQSPSKLIRALVPQLSSSGQGPSTSIARKFLTLTDASKKLKPLKPLEKSSANTLAALKARNILISPISRENVVKNNIARLETKFKACQGNDQKAWHNYRQVASVVVSILNRSELEKIKDEALKKDILSRYELHHEKQKLKNMKPEDRKAYLQRKHKEEMERRRIQHELTKVKCEDNEISPASVLPQPIPVRMPDGLSSSDFGDVLMVTEFLIGFSELLTPQEQLDLNIDNVLQALSAAHTTGFELLTKMIVAFLETLLQTESLFEMGTGLEEITVNSYTASELTRLISSSSKGSAEDETDSGFDASSSISEALNDDCLEMLRTADFYTLAPKIILDILIFVQNKLLQVQSFDEFLKEKEEELTEAWKEKMDALQDLKKYKCQSESSNKKQESGKDASKDEAPKNGEKEEKPKSEETKNALSLTHFYGTASERTDEEKTVVSVDYKKPPLPPNENDENELMDEPDFDSMLYRVKNRRVMSEQSKAKKAEEERVEKERRKKEMELQTRENRLASATKKLSNLQEFLQVTVRRSPLGVDRNYSRYWIFPKSAPGYLFVEKVMDDQNPSLAAFDNVTSGSTASQWYHYNNVAQYEKLLSSLLTKGVRESRLHENMQKQRDKILSCLSKAKKPESDEKLDAEKSDEQNIEMMFKKFLREEFVNIENKIRHGGLGGVAEFDVWLTQLNTAETITDFGACLLEIRQNVRPSLLKGIMALPKKGVASKSDQKSDKENGQESDNEKSRSLEMELGSAEERKREKFAKQWLRSVKECKTWSRLSVLYYILHSCIMWEKSVENAPCKICRRQRDDENIILCDECNDCYHIYCLRPPLRRIPLDDWFCVKCKPASKKKPVRYVESSDNEEEDEDEQSRTRHDNVCTACQSGSNDEEGEALFFCSSCPRAFHMDCHRPPLRHEPRSGWKCCVCVKGVSFGGRSLRRRKY